MGNKLVDKYVTKERLEAFANEEITEDGGLGDIGRKINGLIQSGEIHTMPMAELQKLYMSMVELSGNKKLINMTRVAIIKMKRPKLEAMLAQGAATAIKHSKKETNE